MSGGSLDPSLKSAIPKISIPNDPNLFQMLRVADYFVSVLIDRHLVRWPFSQEIIVARRQPISRTICRECLRDAAVGLGQFRNKQRLRTLSCQAPTIRYQGLDLRPSSFRPKDRNLAWYRRRWLRNRSSRPLRIACEFCPKGRGLHFLDPWARRAASGTCGV